MPALRTPTLLVALGLVLSLPHCAGDDEKKVVAGDAGAGGEAGDPSSGGSSSSSGSTGDSGGSNTGEGGEPSIFTGGGNGGSPGNSTNGGDGGQVSSGGQLGAGGGCATAPSPTSCCQATDPVCDNNWELACYSDWNVTHHCCDAALGVRRGCRFDGDFYDYSDEVCVDECTGKSFGTASCLNCFMGAPACPASGCGANPEACEDIAAGYRLDCSDGASVQCVCNPDLD